MSTKYKTGNEVPTYILVNRLNDIADTIIKGGGHKLSMRVPAEVDYDADLVISECARRLAEPTVANDIQELIKFKDDQIELLNNALKEANRLLKECKESDDDS